MRYIISESDRMQCIVLSLEGGAHATSSIGNLLRLRTCEADTTNEKKHSMRSVAGNTITVTVTNKMNLMSIKLLPCMWL